MQCVRSQGQLAFPTSILCISPGTRIPFLSEEVRLFSLKRLVTHDQDRSVSPKRLHNNAN